MQPKKLVLFIDDKNIYKGARRAFFNDSSPHYYGQINPIELGKLICSRPPDGAARSLHQVRVYTGSPDATKQPQAYAAHSRQCNMWEKLGAEVITRILRYPSDWPNLKAEQKGVDVALAVDFVALAIDGDYNIGVIASTDTDLKPALEYVKKKCKNQCQAEVVAWKSSIAKSRLYVSEVWCHWLDNNDYNQISDLIDYNIQI
jgi:uncharacterized LabA/DUF88 family protein